MRLELVPVVNAELLPDFLGERNGQLTVAGLIF